MIKNMIIRMINSFCYSIAITTVIYAIISLIFDVSPLLPEYAAMFDNDLEAALIQLVLIGIMSAVLAGGTIIMEIEKIGLITQSVIYFMVSSPVWIAVACICWGFAKYPQSAISVCISYFISYAVCWIIQYKICKKNVSDINEQLIKLGQTEEG